MRKATCALLAGLMCVLGVACGEVGYTAIDIPYQYAKAFQNTTEEQIEWYLISSNEWDYSIEMRDGMKTIRATRYLYNSGWTSAWVTVYFDGMPDYSGNVDRVIVDMSAERATQQVDLKYYQERPGYSEYHSNIVLQFSDTFGISVNEVSEDKDRTLTRQALEEMYEMFLPMEKQCEILADNDSIEILNGPWLQIVGNGVAAHEIFGYVHVDNPNTAHIKVVDQTSGEVYYDQTEKDDIFAVGWSDNPKEYVYFYQRLAIKRLPEGPDEAHVDVQLWVAEKDGNEFCAVSKQTRIVFWRR